MVPRLEHLRLRSALELRLERIEEDAQQLLVRVRVRVRVTVRVRVRVRVTVRVRVRVRVRVSTCPPGRGPQCTVRSCRQDIGEI